ncbi:MAG: hypothetical protein PQJ50_17895 [Spirochaetales bacterium]|nr:hypothetical protein [Spirochaetales bacterium]
MTSTIKTTLITEIRGRGEFPAAAALEYPESFESSLLDTGYFEVNGRSPDRVYTSRKPERGENPGEGPFIIIEWTALEDEGLIDYSEPSGARRREGKLRILQKEEILSRTGQPYPAGTELSGPFEKVCPDTRRFTNHVFYDYKSGESLEYSLFTPEDYNPEKSYPLVLFVHDRGVCTLEGRKGLEQGVGGVIWSWEEEQKRHECFVLVPHFPEAIVNDRFGTTVHFEVMTEILNSLINSFSIDRDRIYGVGQSMGTMSLMEMGIRYPDLFGGLLLAAGQWNPETIGALKDTNLWVIVAENDKKAFSGMNACTAALEEAGASVGRARWDGRLRDEAAEKLAADEVRRSCDIRYTVYDGSSIVPEAELGKEGFPEMLKNHLWTWPHVFYVKTLREWLFDQRKKNGK